MTQSLTLRLAHPQDLSAVDDLLARSYPRLLAKDYPPSIMVTIVPIIARARPDLLASGRYYVVEDAARTGAWGGWLQSDRSGAEGRGLRGTKPRPRPISAMWPLTLTPHAKALDGG